jgi:hypothetical protein
MAFLDVESFHEGRGSVSCAATHPTAQAVSRQTQTVDLDHLLAAATGSRGAMNVALPH